MAGQGVCWSPAVDILEYDVVTGKKTSFAANARRALRALAKADVPFAVIGATALGARGLPRFTRDLDVVVTTDDAWQALDALEGVGFASATPVDREGEPEAMYVLARASAEVDLLVASGEPEIHRRSRGHRGPRLWRAGARRDPRAARAHVPLQQSNPPSGGPRAHRHRERRGPRCRGALPRGRAP